MTFLILFIFADNNSINGGAPNPCPSTLPNNVNNGGSPNLYLSNPPKNVLGIPVAGDWPSWLSTVAAEAINGWSPRTVDTFEKVYKVSISNTTSCIYGLNETINILVL